MDKTELKYQITALIDSEITSQTAKAEIINQIELNPELKHEYEILLLTKSLVKTNCKFHSAPEKLRNKIIRQIKLLDNTPSQSSSIFHNIFLKSAFAFLVTFAVILIFILLLWQNANKNTVDFASEQSGIDNMFVQASNNFNSLMAGKLFPQILTDDIENIKSFFSKNGVAYSTCIPQIKEWEIVGAVVSKSGDEKFAHHVYKNDKGELIYLFQVYESCVKKGQNIKLSGSLIKYLDEGKCFFSTKDGRTILLKKLDGNICAIVSNTSQNNLENLFCSTN